MKSLSCFLVFVLVFSCRQKEVKSDLANLVGKWQVVAYETDINGQKQWQYYPPRNTYDLEYQSNDKFRYSNGLYPCCPPENFTINKSSKIKAEFVGDPNPMCATLRCYSCINWSLTLIDNELLIDACGSRRRYKRF